MKACENGIKMSKVQNEMFSSHTISPFPSPLPGKRARAHRDMLIIEFSSQKECSKISGKAWFSSWYVGHCIDHVYHSVLKRLDTAHPSVIVYMLCIVQETFSYRSTNGLQTLVFGLFETFDIIQLIGQMSQIEASSFISWALGTFAVPEEGNLRIRVFRGKGKSIPTHGGIFFFFVANWLRSKRCTQIKLCAVFEGVFIYLFIFMVLALNTWSCCVYNNIDTVR